MATKNSVIQRLKDAYEHHERLHPDEPFFKMRLSYDDAVIIDRWMRDAGLGETLRSASKDKKGIQEIHVGGVVGLSHIRNRQREREYIISIGHDKTNDKGEIITAQHAFKDALEKWGTEAEKERATVAASENERELTKLLSQVSISKLPSDTGEEIFEIHNFPNIELMQKLLAHLPNYKILPTPLPIEVSDIKVTITNPPWKMISILHEAMDTAEAIKNISSLEEALKLARVVTEPNFTQFDIYAKPQVLEIIRDFIEAYPPTSVTYYSYSKEQNIYAVHSPAPELKAVLLVNAEMKDKVESGVTSRSR